MEDADQRRLDSQRGPDDAERVATFETRPREPAELEGWEQDGRPFLVAERDAAVV